jgi:hypothetical protein
MLGVNPGGRKWVSSAFAFKGSSLLLAALLSFGIERKTARGRCWDTLRHRRGKKSPCRSTLEEEG